MEMTPNGIGHLNSRKGLIKIGMKFQNNGFEGEIVFSVLLSFAT